MQKVIVIFLTIIIFTTNEIFADRASECNQPMAVGYGGQINVKFFYHPTWKTCFEFNYQGQGGNSNRFDLFSDCMIGCALGVGCNNDCKCNNTHQSAHDKCNPPNDSATAIACQAWYLRCPDFKSVQY